MRLQALAQIMEMVREYGIDYFDSALLPLDNYISRGTDHFLADPGYLTSLNAVRLCFCIWQRKSMIPVGTLLDACTFAGPQNAPPVLCLCQSRPCTYAHHQHPAA